jgi:hypothetical protein
LVLLVAQLDKIDAVQKTTYNINKIFKEHSRESLNTNGSLGDNFTQKIEKIPTHQNFVDAFHPTKLASSGR